LPKPPKKNETKKNIFVNIYYYSASAIQCLAGPEINSISRIEEQKKPKKNPHHEGKKKKTGG